MQTRLVSPAFPPSPPPLLLVAWQRTCFQWGGAWQWLLRKVDLLLSQSIQPGSYSWLLSLSKSMSMSMSMSQGQSVVSPLHFLRY